MQQTQRCAVGALDMTKVHNDMGRVGGDFANAMDQSFSRAEVQPALGFDDADRPAAPVEDRTFGGRAKAFRANAESVEFVAQDQFDAGAAAKGMKAEIRRYPPAGHHAADAVPVTIQPR